MNSRDNSLFRFFYFAITILLLASVIATVIYISIPLADDHSSDGSSSSQDSPTYRPGTDTTDFVSLLGQTQDAGIAYQDKIMFFGESTTFHMIKRGVLSDGTATKQVIRPVDSTLTLIYFDIDNGQLISPSTGESTTFRGVIAAEKPAYLLLNFGINGLNYNVGMRGDNQKSYFLGQYQALIDIVKSVSPQTIIILQSVYPVADSADCETRFACTVAQANERIDALNQSIMDLAQKNKIYYLNSSEIMKDKNGNLKAAYAEDITSDCMHLNDAGYQAVLSYIRTHSAQ